MKAGREIIIMDLDGTLSGVNTFTLFVRIFFKRSPRCRLPLAWAVMQRKLRLISHSEAKGRILRLFDKLGEEDIVEEVVNKIEGDIRPELAGMVGGSAYTVLATAAPGVYAVPLGRRLGFDLVLATKTDGREMKGEEKVAALESNGVKFGPDVKVYTDHYDDMPLCEANCRGENILINPSGETCRKMQEASISFRIKSL